MVKADEIIERMKRNAPIRERVIENIELTRRYRDDSENLANAAEMYCGPQKNSYPWSDENDMVLRQNRLFNRLIWLWENNGPGTEESFGNACMKMANRTMTKDQYYAHSSNVRFWSSGRASDPKTEVQYKKGINPETIAA